MPDIFNCGVSIKINRFVFVRHKCPTYKLAPHQRQPENPKMERRRLADICCLLPRIVDDTRTRRLCSPAAHAVCTPCHAHQRQPGKELLLWSAWSVVLTMRLVPTGHFLFFASPKKRKQKKGDPDVQVCFADSPLSASFFRRVRTSRALRVVGQAHTCFRKKDAAFSWT